MISNDIVLALILGGIALITIIVLSYKKQSNPSQRTKELSALKNDLWINSPIIESKWLSEHIGSGIRVNLKLEALQPSGSFKIRGISSFMKKQYSLNDKMSTFISTSSANAGMAVAYTAKKLGCKCLLIWDVTQRENELISRFENEYGAEIRFEGNNWNESDEFAIKLSKDPSGKYCYVPMFDDATIFAGHSSIIQELAEQYKNGDGGEDDNYPDCIVCSVGGGGLLNGILGGLFRVGWSRNTKIIAAQCENAALFDAAINNSYKPIPIKTISAEGTDLGFRAISDKTMNLSGKYEKFNPIKSIVVKDKDVLNVSTLFGLKHHVLVEPLCAVAIAAVFKNKDYFKQFSNITIIVCGGNHIYFNKELLNESIKNGTFNGKTTVFTPRMQSKKKNALSAESNDYDEKEEEEKGQSDEINAYDSETEEI